MDTDVSPLAHSCRRSVALARVKAFIRRRVWRRRLRALVERRSAARSAALTLIRGFIQRGVWRRRLQARIHRRLAARSAALALNRAYAQRGVWRWLLVCVLLFAMLFTTLLLALSRSPPCSRGTALYSGDPALGAGDCIAGSMGSRHFGFLPWVSWKPMLVVGGGGEMIATRPDGTQVTLDCGGSTTGGNGFLSRAFAAAPARDSFGAKLHDLRRRGGHVGFAVDGDLHVTDSFGWMVWSLEEVVVRG
ncbi:unnamed protein product, partial [Ascophyllum nodosum]